MNQYITLMLNPKYKCISVHCLYEHDFLRDPFSKSIQHITITGVKLMNVTAITVISFTPVTMFYCKYKNIYVPGS